MIDIPLRPKENLDEAGDTGSLAGDPRVLQGEQFMPVETAEKWLIQKARRSATWFSYYIDEREPPAHHKMWYGMIFNFKERQYRRLNIIAPRESAKTSVAINALAWWIGRFPWLTDAIVSVSSTIAEKRLAAIRDLIENDDRYHNVFPWISVDKDQRNTTTQLSVKADGLFDAAKDKLTPISYRDWRGLVKRIGSSKDPTINVGGVGSRSLIGSRWSGIFLMDDIIDHTMLADKMQDEIYELVMLTYIPALKPTAKGVNVGTRWTPRDFPGRLKNNKSWKTVEIEAMRMNPETGKMMSYWPKYWPVWRLEEKREEMDNPALFDIMYMNNPAGLAAAKFKIEGMSQGLPKELPDFNSLYIGTDFAIGQKNYHDWNAFSVVGIDALSRMYVLELLRLKATPDVVMHMLIDLAESAAERYGKLTSILFEKVGFLVNYHFDLTQKAPHLPGDLVPLVGEKDHRITNLARKSNNYEVFYPTEDEIFYPALLSEGLNYSPGKGHDDMLDSLAIILLKIVKHASNAKVRKIKSRFLL